MRKSRLKFEGTGYYHCMSRIIEKRFIMGDLEKEKFVELMRNLAEFSGLRILTYSVLSNHFHVLLQCPQREAVSDRLLLKRLHAIYPARKVALIAGELTQLRQSGEHDAAEALKSGFTYRMYDISAYFKSLKQSFSQWYNRRNDRTGPLWDQRFKSVMVEGSVHALSTIAAYIDLNAVRAGIVEDPLDYRHCGYTAALGGNHTAREGIRGIWLGVGAEASWQRVHCQYRKLLFLQGEAHPVDQAGKQRAGFSKEAVKQVLQQGGSLSREQLLRCRVRYFTDGVAIGSRAFVEDIFLSSRDWFGTRRKTGARAMRNAKDIGLVSMRDLQLSPISIR
jgi:REP element-mobilizing transposase RayT